MQDRAGLTCTVLTVPPPTAGRDGKAAFQNPPSITSTDGSGAQPAGLAHPSTCQKWMQKVSDLVVVHWVLQQFDYWRVHVWPGTAAPQREAPCGPGEEERSSVCNLC